MRSGGEREAPVPGVFVEQDPRGERLEGMARTGDSRHQEATVAKAVCPRCSTLVNVFPPELLDINGHLSESVDAELHIVTKLLRLQGEDGERFAVRDAAGALTCPACHQRIRFAVDGH
jgi:uncharacterized protein with PIN domain